MDGAGTWTPIAFQTVWCVMPYIIPQGLPHMKIHHSEFGVIQVHYFRTPGVPTHVRCSPPSLPCEGFKLSLYWPVVWRCAVGNAACDVHTFHRKCYLQYAAAQLHVHHAPFLQHGTRIGLFQITQHIDAQLAT